MRRVVPKARRDHAIRCTLIPMLRMACALVPPAAQSPGPARPTCIRAASAAMFQPTDRAASVVTGLKLARRIPFTMPVAQVLRQESVQPSRDGGACQGDPVNRALPDPLQGRLAESIGVRVVINGDLVDIGQLFKLILEHGASAIGAGEQNSSSRHMRPQCGRQSLGTKRFGNQISAANESWPGPPQLPDRLQRALRCPITRRSRPRFDEPLHEKSHAVGRGEHQPVVDSRGGRSRASSGAGSEIGRTSMVGASSTSAPSFRVRPPPGCPRREAG